MISWKVFHIYENVWLFVRSKVDILNVAVFKYSLHKFRENTTLKILINLSMLLNSLKIFVTFSFFEYQFSLAFSKYSRILFCQYLAEY